jgi:branched-chain amino acid transport system substrate-binding protein
MSKFLTIHPIALFVKKSNTTKGYCPTITKCADNIVSILKGILSMKVISSLSWWAVGAFCSASVWAQSIVVSQVGPFTGLPSPDAQEVHDGATAYFAEVNSKGGVGGRKIEFLKFDDQFKGDEFIKQLEAAAAKKSIALITPIGSAALQNALKADAFSKYDFAVVNAIPGADIFRNPGHPRLFHIRASDGQQITSIIRNARTIGITSMGILHQDLPIGTAGLAKAQEIAAAQGLKVTGVQSKHDDASLAVAAPKIAALSAQSVLVIGSPKFMADALGQLRKAGVSAQAFALSYMPTGLAYKIIGATGARGVGIAQTYPNPLSATIPVARDMRNAMAKHVPKVTNFTAFHLEGYISARILVEGLKKAGGNPTAEKLTTALRTMGPQDLGGFVVDFSKGNSGSNFVDLAVIDSAGKLRY